MEKTDDELIIDYRQGDEEAFKILIQRYLNSIYIFIKRMTGRSGDTDDIVSETFVKVWKTLPRYKNTNTFKAWVFMIARNTAIDYLRKKKVKVFSDFEDDTGSNALTDTLIDTETIPENLIKIAEDKKLLESLLEKLEPTDREILTLHYGEEMTFDAIGEILKKPLNTVKSRHRRALTKLRNHLENTNY